MMVYQLWGIFGLAYFKPYKLCCPTFTIGETRAPRRWPKPEALAAGFLDHLRAFQTSHGSGNPRQTDRIQDTAAMWSVIEPNPHPPREICCMYPCDVGNMATCLLLQLIIEGAGKSHFFPEGLGCCSLRNR